MVVIEIPAEEVLVVETEKDHKCTTQYVMNVAENVKFHSDQPEINQYIVALVLKIEAVEVVEKKEEKAEEKSEVHSDAIEMIAMTDLQVSKKDKCIAQNVANAETVVKSHSNQPEINQFIVTTVLEKIKAVGIILDLIHLTAVETKAVLI